MIARFLVPAEKHKKVVFFFNKVPTHRSRVEGHILNKKAGVKMQSGRTNEDRVPSQANQPALGLHRANPDALSRQSQSTTCGSVHIL